MPRLVRLPKGCSAGFFGVGSSRSVVSLFFILMCGLPVQGNACSLPVFRYALERWTTTNYELYVVYDPKTKAVTQAEATEWAKGIGESTNMYPPVVIALDASTGDSNKELIDEIKSDKSVQFPLAVIARPSGAGSPRVLWTGRFADPLPRQLFESPTRQKSSERLLAGESAVWLVLSGGDPKVDAQVFAKLQAELDKAEKELSLPDQGPPDQIDDSSKMRSKLPLRLKFSILQVKRGDPSESSLVQMLEKCDEIHNPSPSPKPIVADPAIYAVMGRGRALPGLHGKEITAETIRDVCEFVAGACSCQVKELNPGLDLVMNVDWEDALFSDPLPTTAPVQIVESPQPELVPATRPANPAESGRSLRKTTPPTASETKPVTWAGVGLAGSVALTILAGVMWRRAGR